MAEHQGYWDRKAERELKREEDPRKKVHTDLLWNEIRRCIGSQKNLKILDAGAGPGRFSIPLAEAGHNVVHIDISANMIKIAQQKINPSFSKNIVFLKSDISHGFDYDDNTFDLVLCLDSPLSFCYNNYREILKELVRITKSKIILCVANKYGVILEDAGEFDLIHFGKLKTIKEVFRTGTLLVNEEMKELEPKMMPSWHAFTPNELENLVRENGCQILRISAPGTFARFMDVNLLKKLLENRENYQDFLNFEEKFDKQQEILNIGAIFAGGLLLSAIKSNL
ncbi:MAG: class I SAM-dependent methyltransferase [Promethearchaeota archaeon]